jgi:hypothetical protein
MYGTLRYVTFFCARAYLALKSVQGYAGISCR